MLLIKYEHELYEEQMNLYLECRLIFRQRINPDCLHIFYEISSPGYSFLDYSNLQDRFYSLTKNCSLDEVFKKVGTVLKNRYTPQDQAQFLNLAQFSRLGTVGHILDTVSKIGVSFLN